MKKQLCFLFFVWSLLFAPTIFAQMYSVRDSVLANGQSCRFFTFVKKIKGKQTQTISYIFAEKRSDISLGCEVTKEENGKQSAMSSFPVAAYTKDESGRMNYNSILPYISICQANNRTILSFECPLIVINPDRMDEKIVETKKVYGKIGDNTIEIINY